MFFSRFHDLRCDDLQMGNSWPQADGLKEDDFPSVQTTLSKIEIKIN